MFKKATRKKVFLKLAITGPSGSGKTKGALRLAKGLAQGGKIAYIDTENGSASLYAQEFDFDSCDLEPPFKDSKFVDAIEYATREKYAVVVIDSASHFWEEILAYKNNLDKSKRDSNSYTNWATATEKYKEVLNAVLQSKVHLICCMRSKVDYVLERNEKTGKMEPKKVGMAAVMREGAEYEFTSVFDLSPDHIASVSKDRTGLFDGQYFQIKESVGQAILDWLASAPDQTPPDPKPAELDPFNDAVVLRQKPELPPERIDAFSGTVTKVLPDSNGKNWIEVEAADGKKALWTLDPELGQRLEPLLNKVVNVQAVQSLIKGKENLYRLVGVEVNQAAENRKKAKEAAEKAAQATRSLHEAVQRSANVKPLEGDPDAELPMGEERQTVEVGVEE